MKPGYKQTEVGVIPEEWEVLKISDITNEISMGPFGSDIKVSNFVKSGVPVLSGKNVQKEKLHDEFHNFVTPEKAKSLKKAVAKRGDIVVTHRGTIGQISHIPYDSQYENYVISQSQFRLRADHRRSLPEWVVLYFHSDHGSRRLLEKKGHTGVPAISQATTTFRTLSLPLPSLPEQRAIAAALSDVDGLLGALDRLIAKKRDLKQAAMQQLLTGQTRLPGFKGGWVVKRLGELGSFTKGSGIKKDESQSGELPCIRYGEIYTRHHDYIKEFHSFISAKVAATASLLKQGDILFAGSGETKAEIGKCVAFVDDCGAYAGGDIVILRPQGVDSLFLGFSLNTPAINGQKASRGQGDAVVHIGSSALADIALTLPPLPEQTAIASVLSEMDLELAALEQRREKTRALKQGMMQELLTGRTRLI